MPENGDAPVDGADLIGEAADSDADLDIALVEPGLNELLCTIGFSICPVD